MEEELLRETFGAKGVLDGIRAENTPDPLEEIAPEVLEECLPQIAEIIEELPDPEEMEELMEKSGCVTKLEQIGLKEEIVPFTMRLSPYVRRRLSLMRLRKMLLIDGKEL